MKFIKTRVALASDLSTINRTIESAVMNWPMQERVKRLSIPSLQYDEADLEDYDLLVAEYHEEIVGVAAWCPEQFHGLYVLPVVQRQGIGRELMAQVFNAAKAKQVEGLLIKSQHVSRSFFEHEGLESLTSNDDEYPWQYWKQLA